MDITKRTLIVQPETDALSVDEPQLRVEAQIYEPQSGWVKADLIARLNSVLSDSSTSPKTISKEHIVCDGIREGEAFVLRNVLSESECDALISVTEEMGYHPCGYQTNYRNNDRIVVDTQPLAVAIWGRVRPHLGNQATKTLTRHKSPVDIQADAAANLGARELDANAMVELRHFGEHAEGTWHASSLNERMRFCKVANHKSNSPQLCLT